MAKYSVAFCFLICVALSFSVGVPRAAKAADNALPQVLSNADIARYKQIEQLQEAGKWQAADKVIRSLENPILMGHVQFQRYMHPKKYRSKYTELKKWLDNYADHPDADRIYALAKKRQPKGYKSPRRPLGVANWSAPRATNSLTTPTKSLSRKQRKRKRQIQRSIAKYVQDGWPTKSLEILSRSETRSLLSTAEIAKARALIASGYFKAQVDDKALKQAELAVSESPDHAGFAHWTAGLAAWRLGRYDIAAPHFAQLTQTPGTSDANIAAGGFWAARAYLLNRQPQEVNKWLIVAARHPRDFYGILARRALGFATRFDWSLPVMTPQHMAALRASKPAQRGVALLQLGDRDMAERELLRVRARDDTVLAEAVVNVADAADLPGVSLKVGRFLKYRTDHDYDAAIYPLPHWEPPEGYIVDRALVLAFMRQESRFDADAKSSAGARGLMQLMPGTASFVAKDRSLRKGRGRSKLYDPEYNISLGQQYLQHLLRLGDVDGDLFRLATAYNGGPGNLNKWDSGTPHNGDPLLFIESIPSRETRIFIERVMENFWIYRQRLGQPTPSLDRLASGAWPPYAALGNGTKVGSDAGY
ncbi:MAG: lytic transglycosylase domain-containing protein [Alphaproteobacteria bacterium]|nr:lytic transglycosylase domain-containing protein [Alphaproteobacteria bacterium]